MPVDRKEQNAENLTPCQRARNDSGTPSPIFRSAAMQEVIRTVERVAPNDVTVLITNSGSARKSSPICSSLSPRNKNKSLKSTAPRCRAS